MTKKQAIIAVIEALAGEDADIPKFKDTKEAIAFLAECLSSDNGAVEFTLPE